MLSGIRNAISGLRSEPVLMKTTTTINKISYQKKMFKYEFHLYSPHPCRWLLKDRDFKSKNKIAQKTCAGEAYLKVVIAKLRALKRHRM